MTEIAFNAELLIFQFVVGDDEYGQPVIIIGEKITGRKRGYIWELMRDAPKIRRCPNYMLKG